MRGGFARIGLVVTVNDVVTKVGGLATGSHQLIGSDDTLHIVHEAYKADG